MSQLEGWTPIVDFSRYQVPGVYVSETVTPLLALTGTAPSLVALIGPSVGYRTNTEQVTLDGSTTKPLSKLGIDTSSVSVSAADGTIYAGSTYTLVVAGGADANLSTTTDNTTTIARDGSGITDGSTVTVSYHYTDTTYHTVTRVDDFDEVKSLYGEPLNLSTNAITSPLSLAAQIAFENGATEVVLVATTGTASTTSRVELQAGLAKLESNEDVTLLVPLPVGIADGDTANVANDLRGHCVSLSSQGLYRIGVVGFDTTTTVAPNTTAAAVASERVVLAFPYKLSYYNGLTATTLTIGGQYLGAAYAGQLAGARPQDPLTRRRIRGFSGIDPSVSLTKSLKNTYSDNGVSVTEVDRQQRMMVRHGVTTLRTSINTREISVVRAKDTLIRLIQDGLDQADLVGVAIDDNTPLEVKGIAAGLLEEAVANGVVVAYSDLKARQLSLDPSVIEIKFAYRPAYPLNYIVVSFSINVETGEVAESAVAA